MRSDDIATMLVAGMQPNGDLGFHQGIVLSWDESTGSNSVMVNGSTFTNLRVLSTGAITPFQKGDTLGLLRFQSTYFILGRIRAPGAGSAERIASSRVPVLQAVPLGGVYSDLAGSFGPQVTMYIGSGRRVLVIHSCDVSIASGGAVADYAAGFQGVQVSGASTIAIGDAVTDAFFQGASNSTVSATSSALVTSASGLNQGQNTFTCKYQAYATGTIPNVKVNNRTLTVIPF